MDILAEMETIVKDAEMAHAIEQAFVMETFGLTAGEALETIRCYEDDIARMAAHHSMTLRAYVKAIPMHNLWAILGFHAGQIVQLHKHDGE